MSRTAAQRRPRDFTLPSGRKVIVSLPGDAVTAPRQHSRKRSLGLAGDEVEVEIVTHGSNEHLSYLQQAHSYYQDRRDEIHAQLGSTADEWEDTHSQLRWFDSELERLLRHDATLGQNFDRFGYSKSVRTYDGTMGDAGAGGPSAGAGAAATADGTSPATTEAGDNQRHRHSRGESTKLFKQPVVRQWLHRGVIWRASNQTEIMAVELFLDLLYVGIIHSNGEHMAEKPTGQELLRFTVTFIMSWKMWTEITYALSWFESDDILTKIEVLFNLACLVGFTTNMINIFHQESMQNTFGPLVGFYVATRYVMAVHFGVNVFMLPMVRGFMFASCLQMLLPTALWIGSIFVDMPTRLLLIWIAIVLDMWGQVVYYAPVLYTLRYRREANTPLTRVVLRLFDYLPAINIEHRVERMSAFVSLVLGYSVVGILFQSNGRSTFNIFLGKAIIGLLQAFIFNWIYFDIDGNFIQTHAIRRSGPAMVVWNNAHLLFIMAYITATCALSRLVLASDMGITHADQLTEKYRVIAEDNFGSGVRYFYCHGLALALLSLTAIALGHRHHAFGTPRLVKKYRLANRVAISDG